MTDSIAAAYSRTKWTLGIRGLLGITLGIFILARPLQSLAAFALTIAVWALLDGATSIARAFALRPVVPHWWLMLLSGVVSIGFGVAALYYYPTLSLSYAVLWTALWLLIGGGVATWLAI